MTFQVIVLPEAERNADEIYLKISKNSSSGAGRWYTLLLKVLDELGTNAGMYAVAPENEFVNREIRQRIFKTRSGLPYRVLYTIDGERVLVFHIRGPGQEILRDIDFADH